MEPLEEIQNELRTTLKKLEKLKPPVTITHENIFNLLEFLELVEFNDDLRSLAIKGFAVTYINPADLLGFYGSYLGKRSIKVYVHTLKCFQDKYYYLSNENFSEWVNSDRREIDIKKVTTLQNNQQFFDQFQMYLQQFQRLTTLLGKNRKVQDESKETDSAELIQARVEYLKLDSSVESLREALKEYILVQGWVKFVEEMGPGEWPSEKTSFAKWNY
jgi:hypothetical protein